MNARKHKKTAVRTRSRNRSAKSASNSRSRRRGHAKMESAVAAESSRLQSTTARPVNLNSEQGDLYSSGDSEEERTPSAESTEDEEESLDPNRWS